MKPRLFRSALTGSSFVVATLMTIASQITFAATIDKADNALDLNQTGSWSLGTVPGANDIASWSATVAGANSTALGGNLSWGGIAVTSPGGAVAIGAGNTLTVGKSGIDMSLATQNLSIASGLTMGAGGQTWNVPTGRILTLSTGVFARTAGATLNLQGAGTIASTMTGLSNVNGITGAWSTVGSGSSTRYATLSAGNLIGYTGATTASVNNAWGGIGSGGTGLINYDITISGTPGATGLNRNLNSMRYTGTGLTQGGNNTGLLLNTNGILNAGTGTLIIGASVNQFGIAASSTATNQLVLSAANADITVNADIRNNLTNASSLVTTGPGTVTLAANNSFTGDLNVNSGLLIASRSNNINNPVNSSLGNPQVARNLAVNSGGTLRITGGDLLGSATTTPLCTLVINDGGIVTNNGNNFNSFGAIVMNGGQLTTSGGAAVGYESYNLMGTVTVGGSTASSISVNGVGNAFNGIHLNTNTLFTVADATANGNTDLLISAPLINRNNSLLGAGGFTKAGPGTMTLTGTKSYTGPTTINAGTLQIGDGTTDGSIATSSNIVNNGSLVYNLPNLQSYANPITGSGTLTKSGASTLTLSGANNFSGSTYVNGGSLELNGSFGPISVVDDALTRIGHTVGGTFIAGSLSFGGEAGINVTLSGPAVPIAVTGALSTTPANGQVALNVTSAMLPNGTYNVFSFGSFSGAATDFTANVLSGLNTRQSASVVLNGTNVAVLVEGDSPAWTGLDGDSWVVGTTGASSNWKLIGGNTATNYQNGDYVLFDDSAAGSTVVNIDSADVSPNSVEFNNSLKSYTLTSDIYGIVTGSLLKTGTGSLTIESSNLHSGGTTFAGGVLNLNSTTALGTGPLNIIPGSAKTLNNTSGVPIINTTANLQNWVDDFTFTGTNNLDLGSGTVTVSGDGSDRILSIDSGILTVGELKAAAHGLTKEGAGTLILTSTGAGGDASTTAGMLNLVAGTLQINRNGTDAANSGDFTATGITGSGTVTNGANVERWLVINTAGNDTFAGTLANGGTGGLGFSKGGAGTVTLTGNLSHTGVTTVAGGMLVVPVTNTGAGTNPVINSGTLVMGHPTAFGTNATIRLAGDNVSTLDVATDGGNNLYGLVFGSTTNSTIISNRATAGEGLNHTFTIIGANGVGGGTLNIVSGPNVTSGIGRITLNQFGLAAGSLQTTTLNPTTASVTIGSVSKVLNTPAQTLGLAGTSSGNEITGLIADGTAVVSLYKSNTSTWTISGANNTYSGNTNIGTANAAGVLRATASGALGTGTIIFDGSGGGPGPTSRLELSNNITLNNNIELHQRNNPAATILSVSGNNTLGGNINLNFGGTLGNIESAAGLLTLSGTISTNTLITRNLQLNGDGNGAVTGAIINNITDPAGVVTVTKNGAGTWTLSGANTYTGTTTVNAGVLSVTQTSLSDVASVNIASAAELNLPNSGTDTVDRLFIGGVEQAPGTWGSLSSSATNKTARITGPGLLSVTNGVSGYSSWATAMGLTPGVNDASTFDAEFDGFDNGTEYLLGGHPLDGSNNPKIHSLIADSSADGDTIAELVMTIAVPQGTPAFSAGSPESTVTTDGYVIKVRGSNDLATFPITVTPVNPVTEGLDAAPVQGGITYEYRSFSLNGSNGTPNKGFLQVTVTHP